MTLRLTQVGRFSQWFKCNPTFFKSDRGKQPGSERGVKIEEGAKEIQSMRRTQLILLAGKMEEEGGSYNL